jgi:hypothetical protein
LNPGHVFIGNTFHGAENHPLCKHPPAKFQAVYKSIREPIAEVFDRPDQIRQMSDEQVMAIDMHLQAVATPQLREAKDRAVSVIHHLHLLQ